MKSMWTKFRLVPALLLALTVWGCDHANRQDPQALLGPDMDAAHNLVSSAGSILGFKRVKGKDGSGTLTAVIGSNGGKITLGEHELLVPKGAVAEPTVFTMTLDEVEHIQVHLTAIRTLADGSVLNVGAQGFHSPVTLKLSYSSATEAVDASRLVVVWVKPDGTFEPRLTEVSPSGRWVTGSLNHFSRYALAVH